MLTDDQRKAVHKAAVETIVDDCLASRRYTTSVVEAWVKDMSFEEKLYEISGDPQCQKEVLGFDPETGEEYDEEQ